MDDNARSDKNALSDDDDALSELEEDGLSEQKSARPDLTCQRCSAEPAAVICRGCLGQFLCANCDDSCHRMSWQAHIREPLTRTNPLVVTEALLSKLVGRGVEPIKARVREIVITHVEARKTARLRGCDTCVPEPPVMLLVGNPGTGKTTIARVLAQVFVAVGLVSNPTVVHLRKDAIPSNSPRTFFDKLARHVQNGVLVVDELQNYARCTNFTQFLVAQTDKGLVGRPVVLLMGYPAPRKPNVEEYLRKSDAGIARRLTDILAVPNFTPELVTEVLVDKISQRGFRLSPGLSVARLRKYVRRIPQRFYTQLNGSLAEKVMAQLAAMQAKVVYTNNVEGLEERLTLAKGTMKRAVNRVVASLAREELATVSASG
jgi:adenylate kinase family enzyme